MSQLLATDTGLEQNESISYLLINSSSRAGTSTCVEPDQVQPVAQLLSNALQKLRGFVSRNKAAASNCHYLLRGLKSFQELPLLLQDSMTHDELQQKCAQWTVSRLYYGEAASASMQGFEAARSWVKSINGKVREAKTALKEAVAVYEFPRQERSEKDIVLQVAQLEVQRANRMAFAMSKIVEVGTELRAKVDLAKTEFPKLKAQFSHCNGQEAHTMLDEAADLFNSMWQTILKAEHQMKGTSTEDVSCDLDLVAKHLDAAAINLQNAEAVATKFQKPIAWAESSMQPIEAQAQALCERNMLGRVRHGGQSPSLVRLQKNLAAIKSATQQVSGLFVQAENFFQLLRANTKTGAETQELPALEVAIKLETNRLRWLQGLENKVVADELIWKEQIKLWQGESLEGTDALTLNPGECSESNGTVTLQKVTNQIQELVIQLDTFPAWFRTLRESLQQHM